MSGGLSLAAAFLLGLIASGHCLVMCGGITGALALATRKDSRGRPRLDLLLGYQAGRIFSYMLAGLSLAGIGAALVHFVDQDHVRVALRVLSAALFALLGLSLLIRGRGLDPGLGRQVWGRLAPPEGRARGRKQPHPRDEGPRGRLRPRPLRWLSP